MTWAIALEAMDVLRRMGTRIVVFEGGEPLLWRDGSFRIHDLVREARKRFLRVAVTTNGTLPLDVPAHSLWVSVDGLKKTHDDLRSGSFDRLRENLERADHEKIFVHCTLNRNNLDDIEGLARWVRGVARGEGHDISVFLPLQPGRGRPFSFPPISADWRWETLLDLKKTGILCPEFLRQTGGHGVRRMDLP